MLVSHSYSVALGRPNRRYELRVTTIKTPINITASWCVLGVMSDISRLREVVEEERGNREQLRDETSFDQCLEIKEVGEFYRNATLSEVVSEFDLSRSEARYLVVSYVKLVNYPTDRVPIESILRGVRFYGGQYSLDELLDESESPIEEVQSSIREFVGVTLAEQNQDIDLRSESIPEDVKYPERLKQIVSATGETLVQARKQVAESFRSIAPQLSSMFQELREQLRPVIRQLQKLAKQVREAIEEGISNFDEPADYDPTSVQLNSLAQAAGAQYLDKVLEDMDDVNEHPMNPYRTRLETGMRDFRDGRYLAPIFSFVSVQDGVMHWMCEQEDVPPDRENRFGDPVYTWDTKRDKLAELNQEWYGISTGDFITRSWEVDC